jgi:hypothetical protein
MTAQTVRTWTSEHERDVDKLVFMDFNPYIFPLLQLDIVFN